MTPFLLLHTDLDRLTFVAAGRDIDAAPLMTFGDARSATRNGKPFFAGTALPPRLVGRPIEVNHPYTVVSPWYDLTPSGHDNHDPSAIPHEPAW